MDTDRPILLELLQSLCRVVRSDQRVGGSSGQLQPVHIEALSYLHRANRFSNTPQALAEYLHSTKGTVSQSLLLLYRRGLITRKADPKDGRVVRLHISAKGRRMLGLASLDDEWLKAFAGIPEKQVEAAAEVLNQALLNLQRSRRGRTFGECQTCRQFRKEGQRQFRCGLTGEPLSADDAQKICREHEPAPIAG